MTLDERVAATLCGGIGDSAEGLGRAILVAIDAAIMTAGALSRASVSMPSDAMVSFVVRSVCKKVKLVKEKTSFIL